MQNGMLHIAHPPSTLPSEPASPIPRLAALECTLVYHHGTHSPAISRTGRTPARPGFWGRYQANLLPSSPLGQSISHTQLHRMIAHTPPTVLPAPPAPELPLPPALVGLCSICNRGGLLCEPSVSILNTVAGPRFVPETMLAAHFYD